MSTILSLVANQDTRRSQAFPKSALLSLLFGGIVHELIMKIPPLGIAPPHLGDNEPASNT